MKISYNFVSLNLFFSTAQTQTHTKPCRIIILIVQIKCPVKLYADELDEDFICQTIKEAVTAE